MRCSSVGFWGFWNLISRRIWRVDVGCVGRVCRARARHDVDAVLQFICGTIVCVCALQWYVVEVDEDVQKL